MNLEGKTLGSEKVNGVDIIHIMDLAQQSTACHLKYVMVLKKNIGNDPNDELLQGLLKCVRYAFSTDYKGKNIYVERIVTFTALFATSYFKPHINNESITDIHPIFYSIFKFILKLSNSAKEYHRYWSCKLFNKIFQELEELSDDLYEDVRDSMLQRLRDPKAVIRSQAIFALHRLQDPTDPKDPIGCQLCELVDSDFNSKVRQLCVENLALSKHTIPHVLNRTRDVDPNVRLAAFHKLSSVVKYLKVSQRRVILKSGFNDSSEKIRNFTSTVLIEAWLENSKNNYLKMIKSIRLDACDEDITTTVYLAELMLNALFKSVSVNKIVEFINLNEFKLIEYDNLNWESVLYYRIAIQYLRQSDAFADVLDSVLPDLVDFCQHIKGYFGFVKNYPNFDELQHNFIVQQLFLIIHGYDVSDTASRQSLNSLVHWLLQNEALPVDVAETVVSSLERTIPSLNSRSIFVCEIISNIVYGDGAIDYEEIEREGVERQHRIFQLQSEIISLQDQEKHFVFVEKNFAEADKVKCQLEEKKKELEDARTALEKPDQVNKKTDVGTMLKCLTIAEAFLRSPTIIRFNPVIATLNSEIISPALLHEDVRVKSKALKCYALCCVIDQNTARYGIHLFSSLIFAQDFDDFDILIVSIKVVVDILIDYGLGLIEKREDDEEEASISMREEEKKVFVGGTSLTDLLQALVDHLEHEDNQVQETAAKGICILLLESCITSPSLVSRIIIKWANPATDQQRIKQFIGFTLNSLASLSNCHTYFGDAVISTIRTLAYAPKGSPLNDVDYDSLIKFMVTLCEMPSNGAKIITELALKISRQMRDKPKVTVNFFFSKALVLLNVPECEEVQELLVICDELRDVICNNQILKNINKFNTKLTKKHIKLDAIEENNEE